MPHVSFFIGYLDSRVLNVFRQSEIELLDLTASCVDQEGLNLGAQDLLRGVSDPLSNVLGRLDMVWSQCWEDRTVSSF